MYLQAMKIDLQGTFMKSDGIDKDFLLSYTDNM